MFANSEGLACSTSEPLSDGALESAIVLKYEVKSNEKEKTDELWERHQTLKL